MRMDLAKIALANVVMRVSGLWRSRFYGSGARVVVYHDIPGQDREQFRQHLIYFSENFKVISLDVLAKALRSGQSIDRCLSITFDDGFKDNIEVAAPLLEEFGLTACFFVATDSLGRNGRAEEEHRRFCSKLFSRRTCPGSMAWEDLAILVNKGFTIGSHTRSHCDLTSISLKKAIEEIAGSRSDIEKNLGIAPKHFAWPFGSFRHFNDDAARIARDAGYLTCFSAERGLNDDRVSPYGLFRDHLESHWPLETVRFFLEGGYDWLMSFRKRERPLQRSLLR